jgi:hypothetical protein
VPENVEQAIRSAIKTHLLHLVGILFPHFINFLLFEAALFHTDRPRDKQIEGQTDIKNLTVALTNLQNIRK